MRDEEIRKLNEYVRRLNVCLSCKHHDTCTYQSNYINGKVCAIKEEEIKNGKR
jgi:hypothetical protein